MIAVGPEIDLQAVEASEVWATLVDPGQLENARSILCTAVVRATALAAHRWMASATGR